MAGRGGSGRGLLKLLQLKPDDEEIKKEILNNGINQEPSVSAPEKTEQGSKSGNKSLNICQNISDQRAVPSIYKFYRRRLDGSMNFSTVASTAPATETYKVEHQNDGVTSSTGTVEASVSTRSVDRPESTEPTEIDSHINKAMESLNIGDDCKEIDSHINKTMESLNIGDDCKASTEKVETTTKSSFVSYPKPDMKQGTYGSAINLDCNFIRLKMDPNKGVFLYEVLFKPNIENLNKRVKCLNKYRDIIGGVKTFDGSNLLVPVKLKDDNIAIKDDEYKCELFISFIEQKSLKECCSLYNILFDRVMKTLKYVAYNRRQFDPSLPTILPHAKLEIWPGYVINVDEFDGGLMICCDVSHRILSQKSVLEEMKDIYMVDPANFKENVTKALLGVVVITRYNNKTYRIDDINFKMNPEKTFTLNNNREISFKTYYEECYNINIKDLKQPLLVTYKKARNIDLGSKENSQEEEIIFLIPEICYLTGLRDCHRSDFRLMQEVASYTLVTPNQRKNALRKFCDNINTTEKAKDILNDWGLTLQENTDPIQGRYYGNEIIQFKNAAYPVGKNGDFSKHVVQNQMIEAISLTNWVVIYNKVNAGEFRLFMELYKRTSVSLGIEFSAPRAIVIQDQRVESFVGAIRNNSTPKPQIFVIIAPVKRADIYNATKKLCCSELSIPNQFIYAVTLKKSERNRQIVANIALQINCKIGGSLWSIKIPFKNVMVCGIDSYHDASQKGNSVSALVASLNSDYTKWYSKAIIQSNKAEIVNGLTAALIKALEEYRRQNNKLPDSIIIYRDGVGDSQLDLCLKYEVPQFKEASCNFFKGYTPRITFIVVQKRIKARFYVPKNEMVENPLPGTVIDSSVTRSNMYDFFLISQSVTRGTVNPSHFIVLRDDSSYKPDVLQRLSYKLTFLYYNWSGSVRLPACCQYAHKLAYLIGENVRTIPSESLSKCLYYL